MAIRPMDSLITSDGAGDPSLPNMNPGPGFTYA